MSWQSCIRITSQKSLSSLALSLALPPVPPCILWDSGRLYWPRHLSRRNWLHGSMPTGGYVCVLCMGNVRSAVTNVRWYRYTLTANCYHTLHRVLSAQSALARHLHLYKQLTSPPCPTLPPVLAITLASDFILKCWPHFNCFLCSQPTELAQLCSHRVRAMANGPR